MNSKKGKLMIFFFIVSILLTGVSVAKVITVKVTGMGDTRQNAINDAQRNAVEKALGVLLESKTYVKEFVTESDRIFTVSNGVVKKYKVIKEGRDSGGVYNITISAIVDDNVLNGNIQMLLHQINNPKCMVIVDPYSPSLSPFARSAHRQINGLLAKNKFDVVNPNITQKLHNEVHAMMKVNTLNQVAAKLALKYNADVAWMVNVKSRKGQKLYGVYDYTATVGCQVVVSTTGKILADEEMNVHGINEQDAAKNAGKRIAQELMERVKVQFAMMAQQGTQYILRLWGIDSYRTARKFKKAVTQINGFSDVKQNSVAIDKGAASNFVELSVKYKGSIDTMMDLIFDQLEHVKGFEKLDIKLQGPNNIEFILK